METDTDYFLRMKAVIFDGQLHVDDVPIPQREPGEALIKVTGAGICNTDIEITRGYIPGFKGILGHEFIGFVEAADDKAIVGQRVTAEINFACGKCEFCRQDLGRHCVNRTVLGIVNRNGAFAEYVVVPRENVVEIPAEIADDDALFIEPLAAALEILDQVSLSPASSVLLLGDGKLALLIALSLQTCGCAFLVVGKHTEKLSFFKNLGIETVLLNDFKKSRFDVVIEASGNPSAFAFGLECVKPRGKFVLKSTYAKNFPFNPAPIVVNEITLIGSRCGVFYKAMEFMLDHDPPLHEFISAEFPIDQAIAAFEYSKRPDALKVALRI
jgi:threonine dehydrogenase-like Zn-dependent dehydrogenase